MCKFLRSEVPRCIPAPPVLSSHARDSSLSHNAFHLIQRQQRRARADVRARPPDVPNNIYAQRAVRAAFF